MLFNYNAKKFASKSNSNTGDVGEETIFNYKQDKNLLTATYSGGSIISGQMLGIVESNGNLRFHYQHINTEGVLRSGFCISIPELMKDGRIRLYESWKWSDGDQSEGKSIVEELEKG